MGTILPSATLAKVMTVFTSWNLVGCFFAFDMFYGTRSTSGHGPRAILFGSICLWTKHFNCIPLRLSTPLVSTIASSPRNSELAMSVPAFVVCMYYVLTLQYPRRMFMFRGQVNVKSLCVCFSWSRRRWTTGWTHATATERGVSPRWCA